MEIVPDKRKVTGLVEAAYEGEFCLPNLQRDFIWSKEEVAGLVRSIVRGIRDPQSYASSRYSGVVCLLSIPSDRHWRRGEDILLQDYHDLV